MILDQVASFLNLPSAQANMSCLVATVSLENASFSELADMQIVADVLPDGSVDVPSSYLHRFEAAVGSRPRAISTRDHLKFEWILPREYVEDGLPIFLKLLYKSELGEEKLGDSVARVPFRQLSDWQHAISPEKLDFRGANASTVRRTYLQFVRPETTSIVISGGKVTRKVFDNILPNVPAVTRKRASNDKPSYLEFHAGEASSLTFQCNPVQLDEALPRKLLAWIALGWGKGAAAHQVLREKLGLTYRQEAIFRSSSAGLQPEVVVARRGELDEKTLRSELAGAIGAWTEADLERAKGMLRACVAGTYAWPIYLSGDRALGGSESDLAYLSAYWLLRAHHAFDMAKLQLDAEGVSLETLRETASQMWRSSTAILLKGH